MKKVINRKVYDTDKARQVGEPWSPSGYGVSDFGWYEETLYRKRTGEYFLHGEGGPQTQYAEPYGQTGWTGGERIMPMTYDEACDWAEEHLDADEYESEFGVPEDGSATLSVTIPEASYRAVKDAATKRGCTMRDLVVEWAGTLS